MHFESILSTVFAEDTNGKALPLIPQSKINTGISAEFNSDKKIYIHKVFLQDVYKFKQPKIGLFETETNAYNLVNFGMSLKLKTKNQPIHIDLGVKNVFNTEYIDHLSRFKTMGIPNPGRNFYVSLKMSLVKRINPHYSYKNAVNYINQRWTKRWKAGNPDLEILQIWVFSKPQICRYYLVA